MRIDANKSVGERERDRLIDLREHPSTAAKIELLSLRSSHKAKPFLHAVWMHWGLRLAVEGFSRTSLAAAANTSPRALRFQHRNIEARVTLTERGGDCSSAGVAIECWAWEVMHDVAQHPSNPTNSASRRMPRQELKTWARWTQRPLIVLTSLRGRHSRDMADKPSSG